MTCIVGLEHEGSVTIGGDAAAISGNRVTVRSDPKVFHVGPFLIGFEDSFRMGQLLRYQLKVPKRKQNCDPFEYMATVFAGAVRKCFFDGGFSKIESNEDTGGVFLVGYEGALYTVDSDYHIGRSRWGYDAIGCGQEFAVGALAASFGDPRRRVRRALTIAEQHCTGVRGPFTILTA